MWGNRRGESYKKIVTRLLLNNREVKCIRMASCPEVNSDILQEKVYCS